MRNQNADTKLTGQSVIVTNGNLRQAKIRIQSIDILRGTVMLIMALDHVRDFFHIHGADQNPVDMATTTPALFFTRWITHFCAPVFVFFSGTSAFIAGQKKTKKELSLFLIKRGLWLVFIEMAIMTLGITFDPLYNLLVWHEMAIITPGLTFDPLYNLLVWQVIWAIGWSMIILGLLVRTSMTVIVVTGCIIFFGHNILDYIHLPQQGAGNVLLKIFLTTSTTVFPIGKIRAIFDLYAILPWTGAMLLGYGVGTFYHSSVGTAKRKRAILSAGIFLTALFIVLRLINKYGDPAPWSQQKDGMYTFLSFLNTTKYPCSLQYLSMTIGPALILLAFIEQAQNRLSKILTVYGRVPFFYYVIHFYLVHTICVILFFASGYSTKDIIDPNTPFHFRPLHFGFDLWVVYLIWLFVITVLYWPCKWFQNYKHTHHQWWLSYV